MMSSKLPMVLQQDCGNSLSMERSLKQMQSLLETHFKQEWELETIEDRALQDRLSASLDDIETMLAAIDRG